MINFARKKDQLTTRNTKIIRDKLVLMENLPHVTTALKPKRNQSLSNTAQAQTPWRILLCDRTYIDIQKKMVKFREKRAKIPDAVRNR